jgi:hypothetical protein
MMCPEQGTQTRFKGGKNMEITRQNELIGALDELKKHSSHRAI